MNPWPATKAPINQKVMSTEIEKTIEFENGFNLKQAEKPIMIDLGEGKQFKIWMTATVNIVAEFSESKAGTYNDPPQNAELDIDWNYSSLDITDITAELISEAGGIIPICENADDTSKAVKDFLAFNISGISEAYRTGFSQGQRGDTTGNAVIDYLKDEVEQMFDACPDAYESLLDNVESDDPVTAAREAAFGV